MTAVMTVTYRDGGDGGRFGHCSLQQLDKALFQALRAPHVPVAEQHEGRVDATAQDDQREGKAQHREGGESWQQHGQEGIEGEEGDGRQQHRERHAGLGSHE